MEVGIAPSRISSSGGTILFSAMNDREDVFFHRAMELGRMAEGGTHRECVACYLTCPSNPDDPVRLACQAEVHLDQDCGIDRRAITQAHLASLKGA